MLRAGLIGFRSVGKTTLFRLLTKSGKEIPKNRKSETHIGISKVPDSRLDFLTTLYCPRKHVPATVEFSDLTAATRHAEKTTLNVAAFRTADALLHVVRAFHDDTIAHPPGPIDPVRDIQLMEDELILADLEVAEKRLERIARELKKGTSTELSKEQTIISYCRDTLEEGHPIRCLKLDRDDQRLVRGFQFLSAKPLLVVINLDEQDVTMADQALETLGLQTMPEHFYQI